MYDRLSSSVMLTAYPVLQFRVLRELLSVAPFLHVHHEVVPRIDHMALQSLQQPWNAEDPTEQERGTQCRSELTRF